MVKFGKRAPPSVWAPESLHVKGAPKGEKGQWYWMHGGLLPQWVGWFLGQTCENVLWVLQAEGPCVALADFCVVCILEKWQLSTQMVRRFTARKHGHPIHTAPQRRLPATRAETGSTLSAEPLSACQQMGWITQRHE